MLGLYQGIGKDLKQLLIGLEFLLSQLAKVFQNYFSYLQFSLTLYSLYFLCMCVIMCACGSPQGKERGGRSPETRVVDVCELPVVGAGNQTLSLGRAASS